MPEIVNLEPFKPMPQDERDSELTEYTEAIEDLEQTEEVPPTLGAETGNEQALPNSPDESAVVGDEQPAVSAPEAGLPPEAQGEVNGGPLGCCFGVVVGLVLSLVVVVASRLYSVPLAHLLQGNLSLVVRIVTVLIAIAGIIIFGYFGWKIGRRFYREYEPPVVKDRRRKSRPRAKPKPRPKGI